MFSRKTISLLLLLIPALFFACSQQLTEDQIIATATDLHMRALTLDTHVDIPGAEYATEDMDPGIDNPQLRCDLIKMERGGLDGVFLAVFVGQRERNEENFAWAFNDAQEKFEAIHRLAESMHPDKCEIALSPDDFERIAATGKRAVMIGIENGFPIGTDLNNIKLFYDLGTRYITLCHNGHNQICDSTNPSSRLGDADSEYGGLSDFGKDVIAEMNRLGIMCDVSHISVESYWDLIETSKAPIIATHSGCRALRDVGRNLDDDQLRALKNNGGVIQIVALHSFLKDEPVEHKEAMDNLRAELKLPTRREYYRMPEDEREALRPAYEEYYRRRTEIEKTIQWATVEDYVDHIDHAVKIAGIDHVGVGTDFDGGGGISGFNNHGEALNVTIELVRRGYAEEDIFKIWGGNLLRVWRDVERISGELNQ